MGGMRRRVVFVSHSRRLYGASRSLLALLQGFRQHGVETCTVLPGPGPMLDALAARGETTVVVPFPCWVWSATQPPDVEELQAAQSRAVAEIVTVLERVRPDVVWSNSSVTAVGALAAAVLGVPHVWHLREVNGDAEPFRFVMGSATAVEPIRAASARIAVSRAVKAAYETLGSGPCEVIYNGIATSDELAARSGPPVRRARVRMLLAGRLEAEKRQLTAIEATNRLITAGHDVELRIVGDGELETCTAAIGRLGLHGVVTLAGFVADLDTEYRRADIALTCSPIEGMGRTTAEAMSYGLPVVGCDRMGTAELIEHEVTGLLYDGSAGGLARAVERLVEQPRLARCLGERARGLARDRFSNERCTRETLEVLYRVRRESPTTPEALAGARDRGERDRA